MHLAEHSTCKSLAPPRDQAESIGKKRGRTRDMEVIDGNRRTRNAPVSFAESGK